MYSISNVQENVWLAIASTEELLRLECSLSMTPVPATFTSKCCRQVDSTISSPEICGRACLAGASFPEECAIFETEVTLCQSEALSMMEPLSLTKSTHACSYRGRVEDFITEPTLSSEMIYSLTITGYDFAENSGNRLEWTWAILGPRKTPLGDSEATTTPAVPQQAESAGKTTCPTQNEAMIAFTVIVWLMFAALLVFAAFSRKKLARGWSEAMKPKTKSPRLGSSKRSRSSTTLKRELDVPDGAHEFQDSIPLHELLSSGSAEEHGYIDLTKESEVEGQLLSRPRLGDVVSRYSGSTRPATTKYFDLTPQEPSVASILSPRHPRLVKPRTSESNADAHRMPATPPSSSPVESQTMVIAVESVSAREPTPSVPAGPSEEANRGVPILESSHTAHGLPLRDKPVVLAWGIAPAPTSAGVQAEAADDQVSPGPEGDTLLGDYFAPEDGEDDDVFFVL
jgi:hypothetical protein